MNIIIDFLKNQKIVILLFFILAILLIIKIYLNQSSLSPTQTPADSPAFSQPPSFIPFSPLAKPDIPISPSPGLISPSLITEIPYDPAFEALEQALQEKPWLLDLPIISSNYIIDYLGGEKGFRVLMKIDISSPLTRDEQITLIKKEAPEKLENIGVNLQKEKLFYTFTP